MNAFRDWPARVVVAGVSPDTNTYVGYSPIAGALKASSVWVVERIAADGSNEFATMCLESGGGPGPSPVAAMDDPASLDYTARA